MVDPQLIFEDPDQYWGYVTSTTPNPEGQFFDRKEVRNDTAKGLDEARDKIKKCISGFTNARGGLLLLGVDNNGTIVGLDHLNENDYNSLARVKDSLQNHQTQVKEWSHSGKKMLLLFSPQGLSGVCKTSGNSSQGWVREAASCVPLTREMEESLIIERSKRFEQLLVCEYSKDLLNADVFSFFKRHYQAQRDSLFDYSEEQFLKLIGACRLEAGILKFTNAGYLFFGANPRGEIPSAFVRFLKYDCDHSQYANPGTAIFDKDFDGSLPALLQKIRAFIKESPYFKRYSYRDPKGSGIIEEPELPLVAVEEAIVNSIIHRDYSSAQEVRCILYKDAFIVRNPGRLNQPGHIPTEFNLQHQTLEHLARNPKLVEWIRIIRDENGQLFVRALSEGTRSMNEQMLSMELPAPIYNTNGITTVALFNNYKEREAKFSVQSNYETGEFANLFELYITYKSDFPAPSPNELKTTIATLLKDKLQSNGWFIDRFKASRLIAHEKGRHFALDSKLDSIVQIFPAFSFQVHFIGNKLFLSIDYDTQIKSVLTLHTLSQLNVIEFDGVRNAMVKHDGKWQEGLILGFDEHFASIQLFEVESVEEISIKNIIPSIRRKEWGAIFSRLGIRTNFDSKVKELSLGSQSNASKERAEKILVLAKLLSKSIFPVSYSDFSVVISATPQSLIENTADSREPLSVSHSLREPNVRFFDASTESNILTGLTKFGAYVNSAKELEIVPLCLPGKEDNMRQLIEKVTNGSMNYRGLERTFGVRPSYRGIITRTSADQYLEECKRLLSVNPTWEGNTALNRLFLVYVPEELYPETDMNSPYFVVKEFLLSKGIPVQMVDTPTLIDPKFKDTNLSLNIIAKTGGTPWVLPNALPEADFFIGLSYSQYTHDNKLTRTMGYANVFNRYGQWQYYKGNTAAFNFDEKHIHLARLVEETLLQLENLTSSPQIHIHYSSKFSYLDRDSITRAIWKIRPNAKVTFVWINTGHNIRLFDSKPEGNGSLSRGAYVVTNNNQIYLSTTGYSPLRKTMGTPFMLEINIRQEPYDESKRISLRTVAQHVLSLTKLNWSSTQSVNGEPVTIKYARDIARLSSAFYRRSGQFALHHALEQTPWFL